MLTEMKNLKVAQPAQISYVEGKQINVVIVSDCEISMAGLKTILRKNGRINIVADCESLDTVSILCAEMMPDIVIFNVAASRDAICRVAESIVAASNSTRMIVLNKTWTMNHVADAVASGILGFITPPNTSGCLMVALESVIRGCLWIGPNPMMMTECKQPQMLSAAKPEMAKVTSLRDSLSPREAEIADLVSQGLSNRAIAEVLVITVDTVKSHLHHIMSKLDVRDRTQIVMKLHPMAQDAPVMLDKVATLPSNVRLRAS